MIFSDSCIEFVLLNHFLNDIFCRFLAKILVPEGSKDVPVGQPIAITVRISLVKLFSPFINHYPCFA